MRVKLLVAGAVTGLLATAGAAGAKQPPGAAQPLPPAQAAALIDAPALNSNTSVTRAVSPEEALAAASLPGATVSITDGLSLEQAVGLAPTTAAKAGTRAVAPSPSAAEASGCAANVASWRWGTWPYDQWINDTTYWCAVYGDHITYRSSSVNAGGTLCGTNSTGSALISGGIGYTWFVMRSSAVYSCPTVVPWVTLHPSHYLDVSRNAWGNSAIVGSG